MGPGHMAWHAMPCHRHFGLVVWATALQSGLGLPRYGSSQGFLSILFYKIIF